MIRETKLKIFNKFLVFLLIFSWVFSPLSNFVAPYLPKPAQKLVKLSQTRMASATLDGPRSATVDAGVQVAGVCADNMAWQNTGASGTNANDTNYVHTNDTKFDSGDTSDELRAYTFGFALSNVTSINGFTVEILAWTTVAGGATYTDVVLFTAPGTRRGEDKSDGTTLPTSDPSSTYKSFGGAIDDWYAAGSWTEAEVESANFGVALCFTSGATDQVLNVDHVRITIDYTAAAPADLSWVTGAADFEIWAGATPTTNANLTWDNGTLVCSTSLTDDNTRTSTCGSINKNQRYRIQVVLANTGGTAASMTSEDFVDQVNVQTYWAGTTASLTDCGFADGATFGGSNDDTSPVCGIAYNTTNNVRITVTTGTVLIAATTGKEGFMYRITTDNDVSLSNSSSYWNASIDSITEDSSKITIGQKRKPGLFIRGRITIRGKVKFR